MSIIEEILATDFVGDSRTDINANFASLNNDKAEKSNVLELNNTDPFVPDSNYEPSTKKYVDDSVQISRDDINTNREITREPTGFLSPEDVIISGDSTARTVTLTGTVTAYYRGEQVADLVSGWTSPAHGTDTTKEYFLHYNGTAFVWTDTSTLTDDFYSNLLIVVAFYDSVALTWVYLREPHGLMQWQSHRADHLNIGTYKTAGGGLTDYVLDSTTAGDRRPLIEQTTIYDEDLPTVNSAFGSIELTANGYTQLYINATDNFVFTTGATDIVPLSGANPQYSSSGVLTNLPSGDFMNAWLIAVPTASDSTSQKYRFVWLTGQGAYDSELEAIGVSPASLNFGDFVTFFPEFVFIQQVTIQFLGGNWQIKNVNSIDGNRFSQVTAEAGSGLSSVSSNATLTGSGTPSDPLGINLANANTWAGAQAFDGGITAGDCTLGDILNIGDGTVGVNKVIYANNGELNKPALRYNETGNEWEFSNDGSSFSSLGAGGATTALDNLASVAINTSLISDTDSTDDLGSSTKQWKDLYVDRIVNATTGDLTIENDVSDGDIIFKVNNGGVDTEVMRIQGSTGTFYGFSPTFLSPGGGTNEFSLKTEGAANQRISLYRQSDTAIDYLKISKVFSTAIIDTSDALDLQTGGTSRLRINNGGNVGIGTATPSHKLEVYGDFIVSPSGNDSLEVTTGGVVYMPYVYNATVGATNRDLHIDNTGKLGYVSSSTRYKENVQDYTESDWIYDLRPVLFDYKDKTKGIAQVGLIAEEVEEVNPNIVSYNYLKDGNREVETVNYKDLIMPLLAEIQKLNERIEKLEGKKEKRVKRKIDYVEQVGGRSIKKEFVADEELNEDLEIEKDELREI